jgi:hypothetical protein
MVGMIEPLNRRMEGWKSGRLEAWKTASFSTRRAELHPIEAIPEYWTLREAGVFLGFRQAGI